MSLLPEPVTYFEEIKTLPSFFQISVVVSATLGTFSQNGSHICILPFQHDFLYIKGAVTLQLLLRAPDRTFHANGVSMNDLT